MAGDPSTPALTGRVREQAVLDRLMLDVCGGHSRALVLRGATGVGKTALLSYLADRAAAGSVIRHTGVVTESGSAYAALQKVCAPIRNHLGRLPAVQRAALSTVLGLADGTAPERLLVGLAALGLFEAAGSAGPLVCVVDDAQWLDAVSMAILAFVARRLEAGSVALAFAVNTSVPAAADHGLLAGLPELVIG